MQGLDIETTALDPEQGRVRLVQIRDGEKGRVYDADLEDPRPALRVLTNPVAHNATFEYDWISRHFGIDLTNLHDTMIMSQVFYTGTNAARAKQFSHSLQACVKRELKREISKDEQGSDWGAEESRSTTPPTTRTCCQSWRTRCLGASRSTGCSTCTS
jgi:ribonuclease D